MSRTKIIIVGLGTTATDAYQFIERHGLYEVLGFAVHSEYKTTDTYLEHKVYSLERLEEEIGNSDFSVFIAILWNSLNSDRKNVYEYCKSKHYHIANLVSPTSIIRGRIEGDNCWINDFAVIQSNTTLKSNIIIRDFSLLGNDCVIESHCFIGVHTVVGGNSTIGEQTFVGMNVTIFDDVAIGKKCIVGAGTVVKRNLPDFSTIKINEQCFNIRQYSENEIESKLVHKKNQR